ncbi:MAG: DNA-protecting protein DprA, partial [Chloroflexi bacterium]
MQENIALLGLVRIEGLGPLRIARLVEGFGSASAVWHADRHTLIAAGVPAHLTAELHRQRHQSDPQHEYDRLWNAGIQVVTTADPHYPGLLKHIPGAPTIVFVRGSLSGLQRPTVSIVGTRAPTPYGAEVTRQFAGDLAAKGFTIVSGLALGIDTIAHQESLAAGGATVAVLPSGVDLIYPERNRTLATTILAQTHSALVSEFYPGTRASPPLFPA